MLATQYPVSALGVLGSYDYAGNQEPSSKDPVDLNDDLKVVALALSTMCENEESRKAGQNSAKESTTELEKLAKFSQVSLQTLEKMSEAALGKKEVGRMLKEPLSATKCLPSQAYLEQLEKIYPGGKHASIRAKVLEAYTLVLGKGCFTQEANDQVCHLRRSETGLNSTLEIAPDGKVYLIFKEIVLGEGNERIVYDAIELNTLEQKAYGKRKTAPNGFAATLNSHVKELGFFKILGAEVAVAYDHDNVYATKDAKEKRIGVMLERASCSAAALDFCTLPPQNQLQILKEFFDHIKALKDAGIHHRDLKADNLLYFYNKQDGLFHIKIADFGLAATFANEWQKPELAGSPWFMAPEYVRGNLMYKSANRTQIALEEERKTALLTLNIFENSLKQRVKSYKKRGKNFFKSADYKRLQIQKNNLTPQLARIAANENLCKQSMRNAIQAIASPATDMWAVGHTLYFMVKKQLFNPFSIKATNDNFISLLLGLNQNAIDTELAKLPQNALITQLMQKCLVIDPRHRATIEECQALLQEYLARGHGARF